MGFNSVDVWAMGPLLILLIAALGVLLIESFAEELSKRISAWLTAAALVLALLATFHTSTSENPLLTPWLRFDALTRFFTSLFLAIGLGSTLLASSFFQRFKATQGEYFFLLLSALFGLILIVASADFLTLFLGLETLSISLYILCGYMKLWEISKESSVKYFLIGSLATAIFLYGIALVYGAVGSTQFNTLSHRDLPDFSKVLFLSGMALVTVGLLFKAAIVPFHVWTPDVYEGASTPVTAFMAVGTKAGAFGALARLFLEALPAFNPLWNQAIAFLAYLTLIYASIVMLRQQQLRRFFAYSGIAHAGFALLPLVAGTTEALGALEFYLVVYTLATLGAFAILALLDHREEGVVLHDLYGLFHRSPFLAVLLTLCLLTLAGIPPTAGFFAKFYVFKVAFEAGYYGLVIVGLLTTILSGFYYVRVIALMFADQPMESKIISRSWPAALVGIVSCAAILALSFYPTSLLENVSEFIRH